MFNKIYIEITNVCNLKCEFCPESKREKAFMSVEDFANIISKVKNYTNLVCLHVKGEPLLHPRLGDLLRICEKSDMMVNITTNATLLQSQVNELVNSKAVRQINLSIHSALQNKSTNIEEYMTKVTDLVEYISENSNIIVSYRVWNKESKSRICDEKIFEILSNKYNVCGLNEKEYTKLSEKVYLNRDVEFTWPSLEREEISKFGKCYGLRNQIAILVDGTVVPCCMDQEGDIALGNIYALTLEEILNSDKARDIVKGFRSNILVEPLCRRCGFRDRFVDKNKIM